MSHEDGICHYLILCVSGIGIVGNADHLWWPTQESLYCTPTQCSCCGRRGILVSPCLPVHPPSVCLFIYWQICVCSITSTIFTAIVSFLVREYLLGRGCVVYNISYCTSLNMHNYLISDLDLFHIPEVILNARGFKFDTNVVVSVTLDKSSVFC